MEDAIFRANLTTGLDREAVVDTHLPEPGMYEKLLTPVHASKTLSQLIQFFVCI